MAAAHTPPPRTTSKLLDTVATTDQGPAEFAYLVGAEDLDLVKIGTTADVAKRVRAMQTGLPLTLSVLWTCEGGRELAKALHLEFQKYNRRGEWFDPTSLGDPVAIVSEAVRRLAPSSWPCSACPASASAPA